MQIVPGQTIKGGILADLLDWTDGKPYNGPVRGPYSSGVEYSSTRQSRTKQSQDSSEESEESGG